MGTHNRSACGQSLRRANTGTDPGAYNAQNRFRDTRLAATRRNADGDVRELLEIGGGCKLVQESDLTLYDG
jgi:hypothetical protein